MEIDTTGSGNEGKTGEGVDSEEDAEPWEDKVEEIEGVKETERQDVEKLMGDEKGREGRVGKEGEDVGDEKAEKEEENVNEETVEKEEERDGDGKGAEKESEEIQCIQRPLSDSFTIF